MILAENNTNNKLTLDPDGNPIPGRVYRIIDPDYVDDDPNFNDFLCIITNGKYSLVELCSGIYWDNDNPFGYLGREGWADTPPDTLFKANPTEP